jgi:hypothetical protein
MAVFLVNRAKPLRLTAFYVFWQPTDSNLF